MEPLSREELERFQKLSNEYEPDIPGPLVSVKTSSHTISIEYANADPTLAAKTSALAATHPFFRIMKGDAVAFGYFESLFALRDPSRVQQEITRFQSLNQLLGRTGFQEHLYEFFVEATEVVLTQVLEAIQNGVPDESFLVEVFNSEYKSNSIITHFRLLTSAWMKCDPHRYQSFLSMPLDQYCATRIETVKTEIDEVGLQALVQGVIEASGFAVEILYLDRSTGDTVTPHLLSHNQPAVATIRLLYRPGHYDLLYRAEPSPVQIAPIVNYQYAMTSNFSPSDYAAVSFDANWNLMSIPNLMVDNTSFHMSAAPMAPVAPSPYMSPPQPSRNLFYSSSPSPHTPPTMPSPIAPTHPLSSLSNKSSDGPQIRLNPLVMKPNLSHSLPVTTPFKNSPYNQAHFLNQDFEPIHWEPSESRK